MKRLTLPFMNVREEKNGFLALKRDSSALSLCSMGDRVLGSPSDFVRSLLPESQGGEKRRRTGMDTKIAISQQRLDAFDMETVTAVRANDILALRRLLDSGKSLDACNRNGETLLHLACRRSTLETVKFLLLEAQVPVDARDNLNRTVLHDACWRPEPDTELMYILMELAPIRLFLVEDARGHTCFDYVRREHWAEWTEFLTDRADFMKYRLEETACS